MLLETVTGKLVDVENPLPEMIDIEDIAWALSRISRFCGMTITVIPYSVAQHSIFVANEVSSILSNRNQLEEILKEISPSEFGPNCTSFAEGIDDLIFRSAEIEIKALLHDAPESYMGDLPSPTKQIPALHSIIKQIESKLMSAILSAYNISEPSIAENKLIKHADRIAQKIEAHAFMQSRGANWPNLPSVSLERLQQFEAPVESIASYKKFIEKFNNLHPKHITALRAIHGICA